MVFVSMTEPDVLGQDIRHVSVMRQPDSKGRMVTMEVAVSTDRAYRVEIRMQRHRIKTGKQVLSIWKRWASSEDKAGSFKEMIQQTEKVVDTKWVN